MGELHNSANIFVGMRVWCGTCPERPRRSSCSAPSIAPESSLTICGNHGGLRSPSVRSAGDEKRERALTSRSPPLGSCTSSRILALRPETVDLTFATQPTELKLEVDGMVFRSPRTFRSWEGYKLHVTGSLQRYNGWKWVVPSWSDGRDARHTIITPSTPTTYVARFERL